jgi:hypothetical protein
MNSNFSKTTFQTGLGIRIHLTDGSVQSFVQSDEAAARKIWETIDPARLFVRPRKLVRPGNQNPARYIGNEVQAMLQWNISRHFSAGAVYAHFFAGEFLRKSPPGEDVNYVSAWATFRF